MNNQTRKYIDRLVCDEPQPPITQALIFPNGDMLRFERFTCVDQTQEKIEFLEKITIDKYFELNGNDHVSKCHCTSSAKNSDYIVYVGEGSWGGDGLIYVVSKSKNDLVWFLFSDSSNPFSQVSIEDDTIIALSTKFQRWSIPINSPETMSIETA